MAFRRCCCWDIVIGGRGASTMDFYNQNRLVFTRTIGRIACTLSGRAAVGGGIPEKHTRASDPVWTSSSSFSMAFAATSDVNDNVFGTSQSNSAQAVKYRDSDGNQLWAIDLGTPEDGGVMTTRDVDMTDDDHPIYIGKRLDSGGGFKSLWKLNNSTGAIIFDKSLGSTSSGAEGISVDYSSGNFYVVYDNTIEKFNSSGTSLASTTSGVKCWACETDASGNIIVVVDDRVRKFNSSLVQQWTALTGDVNSGTLSRLTTDNEDNVYVMTGGGIGTDNYFKLDSSGNEIYSLDLGNISPTLDVVDIQHLDHAGGQI